jgi:carbamoyltransferase
VTDNILGMLCYQGHASSAVLIRDGVLTDAAIEDRFTRLKRDTSFPTHAIRHILTRNGLDIRDIREVAFAWSPAKSVVGQLRQMLRVGPAPWDYFFARRAHHGGLSRAEKLRLMCGIRADFLRRFGSSPRVRYVPHHLAHSYSACMAVPTDRRLLSVVADGTSEDAAVSVYLVEDGRHTLLSETPFPHSFGILYSAVTQLLGFVPDNDEFKVMGLGSYGPRDAGLMAAFDALAKTENGKLTLDLTYFRLHRSADQFHSNRLSELLAVGGGRADFKERARIARALQDLLERRMGELIEQVVARLPRRPEVLCASGGVFLNCLLNQSLRRRFSRPGASVRFDAFHFSPVADDNGAALGAAARAHHLRAGRWPQPYPGLHLGPEYSDDRVMSALADCRGLSARRADAAIPELARRLAAGRVVAFFQGRSEFGPRALGARSILADPRRADMKDRVNGKVKLRESFRPFAPSVVEERAADFFTLPSESAFPYMIETVDARPGSASKIPAVVHVDGTARVQTVSRAANPAFHALLSEFGRLTGVPVLLNTSFNLDGEPIVESPEDAVRCFRGSGLDDLAMGTFLVEKAGENAEVAR